MNSRQARTAGKTRHPVNGVLRKPKTMFTSRWETPPLTAATAGRPFEFVILDSPEIVLAPDPLTFGEHFWRAGPGGVVEFANFGGRCCLVACAAG